MQELALKQIEIESEEFDQLYSNWKKDIAHFIPEFEPEEVPFSKCSLILIDKLAAGLFIYMEKGEEIHIDLDYLSEQYRDKGIGQTIFADILKNFKDQGFKLVVALSYNNDHANYLQSLGFAQSEKYVTRYEISLK